MQKRSLDYLLIGPAFPFRGGISETQHNLAKALKRKGKKVELLTFTKLYPKILFPGKSQFSLEKPPRDLKINRYLHAYNPFAWSKVAKYIIKINPKILVFRYYNPFLGISYGWIAKKIPNNIKKVALVDNWIPHEKGMLDRVLNIHFAKYIDIFTCLSNNVEEQIKKDVKVPIWSGFHPINYDLKPSIDQNKARSILKFEKTTFYVLFFGLVRKYKGLDLLIKAFNHPSIRKQNIKLYVAGECYENQNKYFSLVKKLKLKKKIILDFNFKSLSEIQLLFSASDLIAQTYQSSTQSGVTPIAYHYRKPILVSDVEGLKSQIVTDKSGEIVEREPKAVAKGIIKILDKAGTNFYTKNIENVINKNSWGTFVNNWEEFISKKNISAY